MDRYTKAVLTIIAVCLASLTVKKVMIEPVYALDKYEMRREIIECLNRAEIIGDIYGGNTLHARLKTQC